MIFTKLHRNQHLHAAILGLLVGSLAWNQAHADRLVLRSGKEFSGILSNREFIRENPLGVSYVSLLIQTPDGESELKGFPVTDVLYLLLEDATGDTVIDFDAPALMDSAQSHQHSHTRIVVGLSLVSLGIGMGVAGALSPFSFNDHYDFWNIVLMAGGALTVGIGYAVIYLDPAPRPPSIWAEPLDEGAAVHYRYRF